MDSPHPVIDPKPRRAGAWLLLLACCAPCAGAAQVATRIADWPAEPEEQASNLSGLSKGFRKDLSGAVWNPVTRTLWVCRNGPDAEGRLWVLEEDGAGGFAIASDGEQRAEWRDLGESEGVTFADFGEEIVYLIIEGEEEIHEVDVSTHGEPVLRRVYDVGSFMRKKGSEGAEGITFVPDEHLTAGGFVDADGAPRASRRGMGGLMFVGHQNGGGIYAFDLDRATGEVDFVGQYRVRAGDSGADEDTLKRVVGLELDRSTGRLHAWHSAGGDNVLSVLELASRAVGKKSWRELHRARLFAGPSERSYEGLAVRPVQDCGPVGRTLFLTVDDGKGHSLLAYEEFSVDCESSGKEEDDEGDDEPASPWKAGLPLLGLGALVYLSSRRSAARS